MTLPVSIFAFTAQSCFDIDQYELTGCNRILYVKKVAKMKISQNLLKGK